MKRIFIMRKDLHMSPGKLASQVGHCAEAYWTNLLKARIEEWKTSNGRHYSAMINIPKDIYEDYVCGIFTKIICEAKSKSKLLAAKEIANELGLKENLDYGLIYDKCLTELEPEEADGTTLTGIWFRPLPDDVANIISKKYQLYK